MSAFDLGMWCFMTGQTPEVYRSLTRQEREQFSKAAVTAKKRGW